MFVDFTEDLSDILKKLFIIFEVLVAHILNLYY